jgi:hypothetical protein
MKPLSHGLCAAITVAALLNASTSWADDPAKTDPATTGRATTDPTTPAPASPNRTTASRTTADRTQIDRATIDNTQIIGNRELPKVLYIVPWKKPAAGDLTGPPTESVLNEALAPIDRDVFRRQVHYNTLTHPAAEPAPGAGADAAGSVPSRN